MTENTKKWLTVAGCLVVCAILVAVIASSFSKDKVTDDLLPPSSSQQGDVVVDPDSSTPPPAESGDDQKPGDNVTVNPETPDASTNTDDGNGADFTGTEQTIQGAPTKPDAPEHPGKTEKDHAADDVPEADRNKETPPTYKSEQTEVKPQPTEPAGGSTNDAGQIYISGFGYVDYEGDNVGIKDDSMYENGNKIGIMGG